MIVHRFHPRAPLGAGKAGCSLFAVAVTVMAGDAPARAQSELTLAEATGTAESAVASGAEAADDVTASAARTTDDSADEAIGSGGGAADEAAGIVVTARLRQENLQDVPLSISAVGSEVIRSERLVRIQDFSQKIANFNPRTQNPRTSALSIRGAGGLAGAGDGSEGGVGLIVDNVFYTHIGFAWGPLYDLAAVEVARGPQGTLLGKNTTIGAVIIRTQAPRFEPENEIELAAGNYGSLAARAYTTGPLIDDVLAYRVSFYSEKNDGFYPNRPDYPIIDDSNRFNVRFKDTNRWAIRGQLLARLGPDVTSRLIADYHQSREYNNFSGIVAPVFNRRANGSRIETYNEKLTRLFRITQFDDDPADGEQTNPSRMRQHTKGVSNELTWENLGGHTLTSITAFRQFNLYPRNSQGNYGLRFYSLGYDIIAKQFSQELRLASQPSDTFDYQVGAFFLRDKRRSNDRIIWGRDGAQFYGNSAAIAPAVLDGLEYDQLGIAKTTSYAAFGQGTWHVTDRFDLTGGIRYTHEKRSGSDTTALIGGASNLTPAQVAQREQILINQFGGYFAIAGKRSFDSVAWLINPSFKVTDDILLYASTARGVKSGAINTVARPVRSGGVVVGNQPIVVEPEVSRDWEVGIKTSWLDKTLNFNVNLYWNDLYDYQGNVVDSTSYRDAQGEPVRVTYLSNIPHVRLKGIEVEASWRATPALSLTLAGAVSDVRYVDFPDSAPAADFAGYAGAPATVDLSGERIEGIPSWTLNAGVRYDAPAGSFQGHPIAGFFYVNEFITGKTHYLSSDSTYDLVQKTYGITNVGIGFRREDDSLNVTLWAKNLFDKGYSISKTLGATNTAPNSVLGDPRTYGVSAAVGF